MFSYEKPLHTSLSSCYSLNLFSRPLGFSICQVLVVLGFVFVVVAVLAARDLRCSVQASPVAVCRLNCPVACGIFVPQPRTETTSRALEGELSTNGPAGKFWFLCLLTCVWYFGLIHSWFYPLGFSAIL